MTDTVWIIVRRSNRGHKSPYHTNPDCQWLRRAGSRVRDVTLMGAQLRGKLLCRYCGGGRPGESLRRLTPANVQEIRRLWPEVSSLALAAKYGTSSITIWKAASGRTYRDVGAANIG